MNTIITPELVSLDDIHHSAKRDVIVSLAARVQKAGRTDTPDQLVADAWEREEKSATGMPGAVAIPHCRTSAVQEATLAFARLPEPVDFGAKDGPSDLVFLIAAPDGADKAHLKILAALARSLVKKDFLAALRAAEDRQTVVDLVTEAVVPTPADGAPAQESPSSGAVRRIVAVTACPTGIAHTYMAADALTQAAQDKGVEIHVETQGSAGASALPAEVVTAAEAVIFAADVDVRDKARFAGKPVIAVPVKRGVDEPDALVDRALAAIDDPDAPRVSADTSGEDGPGAYAGESFGKKTQRVLMTGVSYMIPFVAAGGLLIALGFLLGGYEITEVAEDVSLNSTLFNLPEGGLLTYLGAVSFTIGGISMGFLVPALAGYIAYGMADRPGIAPGFTAGMVAVTMDAGFIGGIVGGVLAGAVAAWFRRMAVPRWLAGLMPVVIIPLIATIVASGLMFLLLGGPIAQLTAALETWLSGMTGTAAVLLGVVLALMMCVDLGGPVNKVAYSFAVAGLSVGSIADNPGPLMIMAAVMAAGMVPPLGMALATFLDRRLFTVAERENGKTAVLLGAAFISEGAIPFAAADPLRVLPSAMAGGAVTGALTMAMGVTSQAPHGGAFVFFAIDSFALFVLAVLAGAVVTALMVIALKRSTRRAVAPEAESVAQPATAAA